MFSLCAFLAQCSLYLDVLRAQRIMGFFISITHKPTKSDNLITWLHHSN